VLRDYSFECNLLVNTVECNAIGVALGKSSAANHQNGFLFEDLADEEILIGTLGENPLGEGLFAGIVIQCDEFTKVGG
jgi:hypothetical protein